MAHRLYPFRFRDPVTGKWVRARYRATPDDITRRYGEARIDGDGVAPANVSTGFDPFRTAATAAPHDAPAETPLQLENDPADALERALVALFLRRYVTWCARRRRYAAMNGAARLLRTLT
jgi:hypothetical protein